MLQQRSIPFLVVHVDKIHDNNAGQVAQPQLACDFLRCFQVDFKMCFLFVLFGHIPAAVYINDRQRFRMLNYNIGTGFQPDSCIKGCFQLPGQIVKTCQGQHAVFIKTNLQAIPRVCLYLLINLRIIGHCFFQQGFICIPQHLHIKRLFFIETGKHGTGRRMGYNL